MNEGEEEEGDVGEGGGLVAFTGGTSMDQNQSFMIPCKDFEWKGLERIWEKRNESCIWCIDLMNKLVHEFGIYTELG